MTTLMTSDRYQMNGVTYRIARLLDVNLPMSGKSRHFDLKDVDGKAPEIRISSSRLKQAIEAGDVIQIVKVKA